MHEWLGEHGGGRWAARFFIAMAQGGRIGLWPTSSLHQGDESSGRLCH